MSQYKYIDHVLENYFSAGLGEAEEDALAALLQDMAASPELAAGVRVAIRQALADEAYSWHDALEKFDVATVQSETEARQYARRLLGAV